MNIVYFGNTLNRHQVYVADELNNLTGGDYVYVETVAPTQENNSDGKARVERPYVLHAYETNSAHQEALELSRHCDVALFGADSISFEIERMRQNNRLSFEISERLLKRGWQNLASPLLLKKLWYYHTRNWSSKPLYKLCAGAFCANDQYVLNTFKGKCYKWGYFTNVPEQEEDYLHSDIELTTTTIMWCARFLDWKHPELPLFLAARLKDAGYSFMLDLYGEGELLDSSKNLARELKIFDVVRFCGSAPNDVVLNAMRNHRIFLFTSDRREGWGAVLNEAMSNGCAVVASNEIGAAPFLIENKKNGLIFKSKDVDSLFQQVVSIIENPTFCRSLRLGAYRTMRDCWSPVVAAHNLYSLCNNLLKGINDDEIYAGPCSKAYPIIC